LRCTPCRRPNLEDTIMKIHLALAAVTLPLMLAACDSQTPADPPRPQVTAPSNDAGSPPLSGSSEKPVPGPTGDVYPVPPTGAAGQAPAPSDAGKDSPATQPASTLSESEEKNKMPLAGQGGSHSSDSLKAGTSQ